MKRIPVIKFQRDKYGDELLVDVVTLDAIRKSKGFQEVLRQSFYGVMGLISDRLHFDTPSYFIRTFTKETGQTPLQFRNCPEK